MSATSRQYDVFLSHSSADKPAVQVLADQLRAAGLAPFLDVWHLIPGTPWQEGIEEALAASATVAVFVGPSGISPWHNEEMRDALDRAVRSRDDYRVIPVLLPGADEDSVSRFLARRVWVDFRTGLDDEAALQRLVAGIKGEAVEVGSYELPDEPAPYRGLLPFEAEHARFFFGRDDDIQRLVDKLGQQHFVAVVGASGSGKSSLVKAGLLPQLSKNVLPDSAHWRVLAMTPGSQPLRSLANQLATLAPSTADRLQEADRLTERLQARPDGLRTGLTAFMDGSPRPVFLFVDQFEELFTLCAPGPDRCKIEAEQFIANLADALERSDGQIRVIITLRADFLDRCLASPALPKLLEDRQLLLGPLAQADLRDAIVRPAQQVGAFLEKGMVNTILADVGDEPGNLPLLQHALHELWLARRGPWLTLDAYEVSGGVRGALGRRAQATYDALSPEQQAITRAILLRLIALGEGVSDTRRQAERAELYPSGADPAQVDTVIQALSGPAARLVVARENTVEVVHEALIHGWTALRVWLDEDREALRTHRRLMDAASEWRHNRDESYLYRGARLAEAEEWAAAHDRELNTLEVEFVRASLVLRNREAEERQAAQQRELAQARALVESKSQAARQLGRRNRFLAIALALAVTACIIAGIFWSIGNSARKTAEKAALLARAGELAASAQSELQKEVHDPSLALLLAIEAVQTTWTTSDYVLPRAEMALKEAVNQAAMMGWRLTVGEEESDGSMNDAAFSPDRQSIVTASDRGVRLWDATTGQELRQLIEEEGRISSVEFSPDGRLIVTAGENGVWLWDAATGQRLRSLEVIDGEIYSATFSPDGELIVTASESGAWLWDVLTGLKSRPLGNNEIAPSSATFSLDGRLIVTPSGLGAHLWDVATGQEVGSIGVRSLSAALSPDGQVVVVPTMYPVARLWDTQTGKELRILVGHEGVVFSAAYSPDGNLIVTTGEDGTARLWDGTVEGMQWMFEISPGEERLRLLGHDGLVTSATFSLDSRLIVTAGEDGTARVWEPNLSGVPEEWNGNTESLLARAAQLIQRVPPELSDGERVQYGLE